MQTSLFMPPWDEIDTVLLDMDGTLLDLKFDNFFWRTLVPTRYARLHGLAEDEARRRVARVSTARSARCRGIARITGRASLG